MAYKTKKTLRKLKQVNIWGLLAGFLFLITLIVIGFYVYTKMQIGRMEKELKIQESILIEKRKELSAIMADPWYMKYEASKIVEFEENVVSWKDTLIYLIAMYDDISSLDDDYSGVSLEDFNVTFDHTVNLRGTVSNIRNMYLPDGLIDRFTNLEAIEFIDIPFYKKNDGEYDFVLDATIKNNESAKGSL